MGFLLLNLESLKNLPKPETPARNPFPCLETDRLVLRQLTEADAPDILAFAGDKDTAYWAGMEQLKSLQDAEIYAELANSLASDPEWGITLKGEDKVIGIISVMNDVNSSNKFTTFIGYLISKDYARKGYMAEALTAVCKHVFANTAVDHIECEIRKDNIPSRGLAMKCGFVQNDKQTSWRLNHYHKPLDEFILTRESFEKRIHKGRSILISGDFYWRFEKTFYYPDPSDHSHYDEDIKYSGIGGDAGTMSAILSSEGWDVYAQATLDLTQWSDRIEKELRARMVDTRFVARIPQGGGGIIVEEHGLTRAGDPRVSTYTRGTWSKYAKMRPLTAREEVPALLESLDFTPEFYFFNTPDAGFRKLAEALKARGTKIVYYGSTDKSSKQLTEALNLCDFVLNPSLVWEKATMFHEFIGERKIYRDRDFERIIADRLPNVEDNLVPKAHKLLYVHGSNSVGDSRTTHRIAIALPDWRVIAPDCPEDPYECLQMLREIIDREKPDIVVGSSMGGMYVSMLHGVRRICVNPAFWMSKDEDIKIGTHRNNNTVRKDGWGHYEITPEIYGKFLELEEHMFDGITESDKALCYGLFGTMDTEVPYAKEEFIKHYGDSHVYMYDGYHSLGESGVDNGLVPILNSLFK